MNQFPSSETPEKAAPSAAPSAPGSIPPVRVDDASSGKPLKVKKRGQAWKVLGLTLLAGTAGGATYLTQTKHGQEIAKTVQQDYIAPGITVLRAKQNPELVFQQEKSDVVNILLVGRDQGYRQVYRNGINVAHEVDPTEHGRSDTMIVVSLNRAKNTIRMVSLPRDITIHLPPNQYHVRLGKLNAAHSYGGVEMLKQTLQDEMGLTIHHYAVIKFDGFMKLIDEVGGVYVDVLGALHRDGSRRDLLYNDNWAIPPLHIKLKPGKQWLSGKQAHAYVRFRMDLDGDTDRIRRQQSVMRALASRLKQLSPTQIPGVMKMIREQFETDMDDAQLASTGFFAQSLGETSKMQPITLYGSYIERGGARLNLSKNKVLLAAIFGPTFDPERFMQHSPTTRGYEFGPDETKPDTRAILREAGLIEGEPRVATGETSRSALEPSGFASTPTAPLSLEPGSAAPVPTAARDPFAFTAPEPPSPDTGSEARSSRASEPSRDEDDEPAEKPRRRRARSSSRRERSSRERTGEPAEDRSQEPVAQPDSDMGQGQIPRPEAESGSSDLSVESPIPQPE